MKRNKPHHVVARLFWKSKKAQEEVPNTKEAKKAFAALEKGSKEQALRQEVRTARKSDRKRVARKVARSFRPAQFVPPPPLPAKTHFVLPLSSGIKPEMVSGEPGKIRWIEDPR